MDDTCATWAPSNSCDMYPGVSTGHIPESLLQSLAQKDLYQMIKVLRDIMIWRQFYSVLWKLPTSYVALKRSYMVRQSIHSLNGRQSCMVKWVGWSRREIPWWLSRTGSESRIDLCVGRLEVNCFCHHKWLLSEMVLRYRIWAIHCIIKQSTPNLDTVHPDSQTVETRSEGSAHRLFVSVFCFVVLDIVVL
jgi:hypothetical protein